MDWVLISFYGVVGVGVASVAMGLLVVLRR